VVRTLKRTRDARLRSLACLAILLAPAAAALPVCTARGATYYVSPKGDDRRAGSRIAPFGTIQRAADVVRPGDTVVVRDGVYTGTGTNVVTLTRSGTARAPITFRSENRWGAVLDGGNVEHSCFVVGRVAYVVIEGFEMRGAPFGGVWTNDGAAYVLVRGNHIHHIGNRDTTTPYGICGVFEGKESSYHKYDGNVFHDIGRTGPPSQAFNHDHAIYNCGDHAVITNNTFYNCHAGWCITMAGYDTVDDVVVSNNVFGPGTRRGQIILSKPCRRIVIQNNIFYKPGAGNAINFLSKELQEITIRNNLVFGAGLKDNNDGGVAKLANNLVGPDPRFRDPDRFDFHLLPNSPAIDAGIDELAPDHDAEGNRRPQGKGYDLGAYEFGSTSRSRR